MKLQTKIAATLAALALAAVPATVGATAPAGHGPEYNPAPEKPEKTPGPSAGMPEKAKAYGVYCKTESRKHVKGEKGTAFSRCVTAMARAATNEDLTPRQACKGESREHVKGEKGTAFSRCVSAAAKLRKEQHAEEQQD